jgi:serine/threonine protein kinase
VRTLKDCLSPPYAAPEQFQFIHATSATDVYAVGCIGYALLTGRPPFDGPAEPDYCDQHLHADPPVLPDTVAPRLKTLLSMMLRKASTAYLLPKCLVLVYPPVAHLKGTKFYRSLPYGLVCLISTRITPGTGGGLQRSHRQYSPSNQ